MCIRDRFRTEYCEERPHEALGQRTPLSCYMPSLRRMPAVLPELLYPLHDDVVRVDASGHLRVGRVSVFLTSCRATEHVGIRELHGGTWLITFANIDLGRVITADKRFEPGPSPFGATARVPDLQG